MAEEPVRTSTTSCLRHALGCLCLGLLLAVLGCDRSGPNQYVTDWEVYIDVRATQAMDRWMMGKGIETHDLTSSRIRRTIPVTDWLRATPRLVDGAVPETSMTGTVANAPAPLAVTAEQPVEYFPHDVLFLLRHHDNGTVLLQRDLRPGYNTFKTFLDAQGVADAGFIYRGNFLQAVAVDWSRGRHQSIIISVTAQSAGGETDRGSSLPLR
jgi:hypothetical protein